MKIEIDLNGIFDESCTCGDSGSVASTIKEHVIYEAKQAVWNKVKDQVVDIINKKISDEFDLLIGGMVNGKVLEYMKTGMMTINAGKKEEKQKSIDEYLNEKFTYSFQNGNLERYMRDFSVKAVEEMKHRYDTAFAMHIVQSLGKQGLLKDSTLGSF